MTYINDHFSQVVALLFTHIRLTVIAVSIAIIIGVPLGILINRFQWFRGTILGTTNLIQAVPSMALLGFMIPLFGIGEKSAIIVVTMYSLLPIVKNTYIGMNNIDPNIIESATGIGMKKHQILSRIQFPLALPFIMAGVRISAVTAVGLMTIAAFIGAGGLGFLVFSGIRTLNNEQILAGAIPAVILALSVDWILGVFEFTLTPIGLKLDATTNKNKLKKRVTYGKVFLVMLTILGGVSYVYSQVSRSEETIDNVITIGSKDFTEQQILGHILSDLIEEKTALQVDRKVNLGGTQVVFSALQRGDVDMYFEYTGTIHGDILKQDPLTDMKEVYEQSKQGLHTKYDITVLEQFNFNNTYSLAITQELSDKHNIKKISDLASLSSTLTTGTTFEFLNRKDGLPGLTEQYGLKFKETLALDGSARYQALEKGDIQVIDAFSTDGLLKKFNLFVLEDDQKFFPPYYAVPLINPETLQEHPEIESVLSLLHPLLTNEVMIQLNYLVDVEKKDPRDVAHQFLVEKKLIE